MFYIAWIVLSIITFYWLSKLAIRDFGEITLGFLIYAIPISIGAPLGLIIAFLLTAQEWSIWSYKIWPRN